MSHRYRGDSRTGQIRVLLRLRRGRDRFEAYLLEQLETMTPEQRCAMDRP